MAKGVFQPTLSQPRGSAASGATEVADTSVGEGLASLGQLISSFGEQRETRREAAQDAEDVANEASVTQAVTNLQQGLEQQAQRNRGIVTGRIIEGSEEEQQAARNEAAEEGSKIQAAAEQGVFTPSAARTATFSLARKLFDKFPGQADTIRDQLGLGAGETPIYESVEVVDPLTQESIRYLENTKGNFSVEDLRRERRRRAAISETAVELSTAEVDDFAALSRKNMAANLQAESEKILDKLPEQGGAVTEVQAESWALNIDAVVNEQLASLDSKVAALRSRGENPNPSRIQEIRQGIIQRGDRYKSLLEGRTLGEKLKQFVEVQRNFLKAKSDYENVTLLAEVVSKLGSDGNRALNDIMKFDEGTLEQLGDMFPDQFGDISPDERLTGAGVRARVVQGLNKLIDAEQVPPGWENFYQHWIARKARVPGSSVEEDEANKFADSLEAAASDPRFEAENYSDTLNTTERILKKSGPDALTSDRKRIVSTRVKRGLSDAVSTLASLSQNVALNVDENGISVDRNAPGMNRPAVQASVQSMPNQRAFENVNAALGIMREFPSIFGNYQKNLEDVRERLLQAEVVIDTENAEVEVEPAQREQGARQGGIPGQGENGSERSSPRATEGFLGQTLGNFPFNLLEQPRGIDRSQTADDEFFERTVPQEQGEEEPVTDIRNPSELIEIAEGLDLAGKQRSEQEAILSEAGLTEQEISLLFEEARRETRRLSNSQ